MFLNITRTYIHEDGSVSIVGNFGINGQQYDIHVDRWSYGNGEFDISVALFPHNENHWFKADNIKDKLAWGEYGVLSFNMEQTLALAGLAMSDRKIERQVKSVA